ncbi:MAG: hypothetical protein VKJ06_06615 [Vampirovibrionales bacterium]|nr:hypothetical protein [Vampirovibrionales bacterium]
MRVFQSRTFIAACLLALLAAGSSFTAVSATDKAATKPAVAPATGSACIIEQTPCSQYATVTPLDLVRSPGDYLEKPVRFEAEFSTFTMLGLDYSRAKRDSRDYYGLTVRRPDVKHHVIPLPELKLFAKRKENEDKDPWLELERGDQILVYGKVFATALREPWMDIQRIDVLKKAPLTGRSKRKADAKKLEE